MYSVYIIEAPKGLWYYGSSDNVQQRIADHNTNRAKYTRFKGPWRQIFQRDFEERSEAIRFELLLKRTRNKKFVREKYAPYFLAQ